MARARIDRKAIIDAALSLIDAEGIEALSMRRLGALCGIEAMSLYNHVKDKGEVLDGGISALLDELEPPPLGLDWREDLAALARSYRAVLVRHPRALPIVTTRPVNLVSGYEKVEVILEVLARGGLTGLKAVYALNGLMAFVMGHALLDVGSTPGMEDDGSKARDEAPPHLRRVLEVEADYSLRRAEEEFEFGLAAWLRGLGP